MSLLTPAEEREDIFATSSRALAAEMRRLARAVVVSHQGGGSSGLQREQERFQSIASSIVEYGVILGQRRTLLTAQRIRRIGLAARREPLMLELPKIPFREAIEEFQQREPLLAGSAAEVRDLYATSKAFAITRDTMGTLTARVQGLITGALTVGGTVDEITDQILALPNGGDLTRSYAENVFRTNIATAYSEGQKQMAADPDIKPIIPCFLFASVGDVDTRPGHKALDGLIAAQDAWVWDQYTPPLYYQCRCAIDFMDIFELRDRGLIGPFDTVDADFIVVPATWDARETEQLFAMGAA